MATTTTRRGLPYPTASDTADVPRDIGLLATAIDNIAFDNQGTAAARPAAGSTYPGTYYYATDTGVLSRSIGTTGSTSSGWADISPKDAAAGTASLRTLGTTSTTAAAGNDSRFIPTAAVTSLPGSPTSGQLCVFQTSAMATLNARWLLQYNGTKWEVLGGDPIISNVDASETPSGTAYAACTTAGPTVTIPVAGDYLVEVGHAVVHGTGYASMSYDIGGTGAVDADGTFRLAGMAGGGGYLFASRIRRKTLTAVTLTAKYKNTVADGNAYFNRSMVVTPVLLG